MITDEIYSLHKSFCYYEYTNKSQYALMEVMRVKVYGSASR